MHILKVLKYLKTSNNTIYFSLYSASIVYSMYFYTNKEQIFLGCTVKGLEVFLLLLPMN